MVGFYVAAAINFLGALILFVGNVSQHVRNSKKSVTDGVEMDEV